MILFGSYDQMFVFSPTLAKEYSRPYNKHKYSNNKLKSVSTVIITLPWYKKLLLGCSHFLYGSANACFYPFLSVWLTINGFNLSQIGFIATLNQVSVILLVPMRCLVVDTLTTPNINANANNTNINT